MCVSQLCHTYLIAIADLQDENKQVRSVDVAKKLNCSRASVNYAMGKLKEKGYINQERYKQISMTSKGQKQAADICLKRELLERFFVETLNISREIAAEQADAIEHCVHDEVYKQIRKTLCN